MTLPPRSALATLGAVNGLKKGRIADAMLAGELRKCLSFEISLGQ
jgi:hypothetical protein